MQGVVEIYSTEVLPGLRRERKVPMRHLKDFKGGGGVIQEKGKGKSALGRQKHVQRPSGRRDGFFILMN